MDYADALRWLEGRYNLERRLGTDEASAPRFSPMLVINPLPTLPVP